MPALCPIIARAGAFFKKGKAHIMRYYEHLDVYVTDLKPAEVSYNLETGKATIIAATEADVEKGIAELEARSIDLGAAEPDEADEYRGFMLQAFDHATDELLNDETKAEAHRLTKMYYGFSVDDSDPLFAIMCGFIIGMSEGMRIADTLNAAAAEQAAQ